MENYKLITNTMLGIQTLQRLSDGAFIPLDTENRDYKNYLAWVALGNKPLLA